MCGFFGQLAHFVRDHGEAPAVLAGARGFDGRVQRQQIGLVGNIFHLLHVGDGARTFHEFVGGKRDLLHRVLDDLYLMHHFRHAAVALLGLLQALFRHFAHHIGVRRHRVDTDSHRSHCRRSGGYCFALRA